MKDRNPLAYALRRLRGIFRPPVRILPPPQGVRFDRDVEVAVRDGTLLRVNVFRPQGEGRYPVILCAHPYRKDDLPKSRGRGFRTPFQYRLLRQTSELQHSAWTSWEAPDPAFWVPRGYVVVNCDLRGFGRSDGVGELISDAEARDYYDLIEWAAAQPWATGKVGLNGVSYLALSQWKVAALQPPHLAAICPWEGFTDAYRDFAYPGGVREDGFIKVWCKGVKAAGRPSFDFRAEQCARPQDDEFWAARRPALSQIQVPALICGSFSDHNLHSRGSFNGFMRIGSTQRWLYTHRTGKWAAYYSQEGLTFQARFFDHFLKGEDTGITALPPVRLEVRSSRDSVHQVRQEAGWPLPQTEWTALHLHPDQTLRPDPPADSAEVSFRTRGGRASFTWDILQDTELSGPMVLHLSVEARGLQDLFLFCGVRKLRQGKEVFFEGSYGFGCDMVTKGWLRAAHRAQDPAQSQPWQPVHSHRQAQPLAAGEIVPVAIELLPSATFFEKGTTLRLDIAGEWFYPQNPLLGQFPAGYQQSQAGTAVLHLGDSHRAHLLVPRIPPARRA